MSRELLLLRHGKSDWAAPVEDFKRPLKNRGKRAAQRMGVWLWQQDLRPDLIISSPAERAINTAQKCCKAMGMGVHYIQEDKRVYEASVEALLALLSDVPANSTRVMLVGHNPGLEDLLLFLAKGKVPLPSDGKLLPTASLAHLALPVDWRQLGPACASLKNIVRGRDLPDGFPYPAPHGKELRKRPAYYYTQSAVIPYRLDFAGQANFLLIGSSGKRHWVVPKGIKDPDMTAQQAAEKEAWEEAGIRGEVSQASLGSYTAEKWGAPCHVDVYAMQVTEFAHEDDWQESHRTRHWLPAEQAAAKLKQPELGALLRNLAARLGDEQRG